MIAQGMVDRRRRGGQRPHHRRAGGAHHRHHPPAARLLAPPRAASLGPGDLRPIAARTVELLGHPGAQARRRRSSSRRPRTPLTAQVDPAQLQQVLTNLVVNGMQAMPRRRPPDWCVSDTSASRHRRTSAARPADYAAITVEDEGAGIAAEHLPRIFEPFFTTKDVGEGTGLGLSVAYGIVREHGGWIDVESSPGRGQPLHRLPATGARGAAARGAARERAGPRRRRRSRAVRVARSGPGGARLRDRAATPTRPQRWRRCATPTSTSSSPTSTCAA